MDKIPKMFTLFPFFSLILGFEMQSTNTFSQQKHSSLKVIQDEICNETANVSVACLLVDMSFWQVPPSSPTFFKCWEQNQANVLSSVIQI